VGDTSGSANASFLVGGAFTIGRAITVQAGSSGTATLGGNTANPSTFTGAIALNKSAILTAAGGGSATFSGLISSAGGATSGITKQGSGTVILSRPTTYTDGTTLSAGTLKLGVANALPTGSSLTVNGTGTFDLNGFNQQVGGLADGGVNTGSVTDSGAAATFTVNTSVASSFSGRLSGALALSKTGSGTLTLSGANTYSGTTTLNAGVLLVDNSTGSGTGTGPVTVNGGTLGGTGSVSGAITVNAATLDPGDTGGTGKLSTGGGLTFAATATYSVELNGTAPGATANGYDQLAVTGTALSAAAR
jgi:autotransporter-associated beta strand protein